MNIVEGDEVFVRQVLISGLDHTRPKTVDQLLTVHPGDPLNQAALLETQRRLYNLALFNEVNPVVQNPSGDELRKNVLLQLTEAKRWDFNYGFGFEAQTGNPSNSCTNAPTLVSIGINPNDYTCSPNGKTGVSPAVLFDVTRTNVRGTNQSISLRTAYGTLEQRATVLYTFPNLFGLRTFEGSFSGGYISAQDVTTYTSSQLFGLVRVTERPDRRNTLIYEFSYRRVRNEQSSKWRRTWCRYIRSRSGSAAPGSRGSGTLGTARSTPIAALTTQLQSSSPIQSSGRRRISTGSI